MSSTSRLSRGRVLASLAALVVVPSLMGSSRATRGSTRGVTFKLSMQVNTALPQGEAPWQRITSLVQVLDGWFADGRERLDLRGYGAGRGINPDVYLLVDSTSSISVDTAKRTYSDTALEVGAVEALTRVGRAGGRITALSIQFDSLSANAPRSPGEALGQTLISVDGRPVRRYRLTLAYTAVTDGKASITRAVTDYWVMQFPVNPINPLDSRVRLADAPAGRAADWRVLVTDLSVLHTGTVMKIVTYTVAGYGGTTESENTRTVDLSSVRVADVDEGRLQVPTGFQRVGRAGGR